MDKQGVKQIANRVGGAIALIFILWRGYEAANGRGNVLLSGLVGGISFAIGYLITGAYYYFTDDINIFTKD